jgi:hypothetical protein
MMITRSIGAGLLLAAVSTGACAPVKVASFADSRADFTAYRTYAWADDAARTTGDPRLDNNPFFHDRLKRETDVQLARRGYEKASSGTADLSLHYHASVTQEVDVMNADRGYETCTTCGLPSVYEAGSIVLDLVEPKTNKLIWRGWATGSMDGAIDSQAFMEQRIDDVVARVVSTLPRR